ncbi:MAG: NAD(+) synthase [Bacilli bacterium]|nr:NAD(+) synthase [Bacilli bacterium]
MFNAKKEKDKIVKFIRDYFDEYNLGGVVIGISGGKDSGVVAGLFAEAIGAENIVGITMPCHSKNTDRDDAKLVSDYYGFKMLNMDLTETFETFKDQIKLLGDFTEEELKNSDINLKPRLRMATLYYIAALQTALKGKTYIVAGTGNKCEEFVGYFTKGGDSVSDIKTIADLTVDEVIQVGEELNVPKEVLYKAPSDGLSGMIDEDKLGVKYKDIAKYMNGEDLDEDVKQKIKKLHDNSRHKFFIPTYKK